MDPVSHALLGRSLNCLDSRQRFGPGAAAAFVLGSLAPDLDIGLVTRGWDVYLHYHTMGTHTVAAAPLLAAATAAVVRASVRGSLFVRLFVAALVGVIVGHLWFDLMSGSDMRLLAPLSYRLFAPHLLTMADAPAVAVPLAGTLLSMRRRTAGGWLVVLGLAVLVIVKAASMQVASRIYRAASGPVTTATVEAVNGSLVQWRYFDRVAGRVRAWTVDAWRGDASIVFSRAGSLDPAVERTRGLPTVKRFFGFAQTPFARIEESAGERRVLWSDLKDCDRDRCVLSFGAILGPHGEPRQEIVEIGGYRSIRPLEQAGRSDAAPPVQ